MHGLPECVTPTPFRVSITVFIAQDMQLRGLLHATACAPHNAIANSNRFTPQKMKIITPASSFGSKGVARTTWIRMRTMKCYLNIARALSRSTTTKSSRTFHSSSRRNTTIPTFWHPSLCKETKCFIIHYTTIIEKRLVNDGNWLAQDKLKDSHRSWLVLVS